MTCFGAEPSASARYSEGHPDGDGFLRRLKREGANRRQYQTWAEARADIFDYSARRLLFVRCSDFNRIVPMLRLALRDGRASLCISCPIPTTFRQLLSRFSADQAKTAGLKSMST